MPWLLVVFGVASILVYGVFMGPLTRWLKRAGLAFGPWRNIEPHDARFIIGRIVGGVVGGVFIWMGFWTLSTGAC